MITSFLTTHRAGALKGKRTNFPEKIIKGIVGKVLSHDFHISPYLKALKQSGYHFNDTTDFAPKIHTIRHDVNDRYQIGKFLHLCINSRQKNMCIFLPPVPITNHQKITITHKNGFTVRIDRRKLSKPEIQALANNDGFESVEDFKEYFNKDFKGKLVHYTNYQY